MIIVYKGFNLETKIFKIARYKDFSKEKNTPDLTKTIEFLQNGDFKSADSKKLVKSSYFRAKIDDTNRLIFTFLKEKEETYIALLEVILNHDYNKSKFLRDKTVELEDFNFEEEKITEILLNPKKELRYLDKFISFSDEQENILTLRPPLLIIGSAGSGKTSVAIEKLKELEGKVLYISLSQHLVDNSKSICGEKSNIDFYSFDSFLNNIEKQDKKEIDFNSFKIWALKNKIRESEKYFEEFKGVLAANYSSKYLLEDEYVSMGIKQSLFKKEERIKVYKSFINYLKYLEESHFYDANIVIFDLLEKIQKVYDFIIIDEVQDFTNKEIYFISQALKNKNNIIFSGDSNQIIYSNFFSWSNLKTMLFDESKEIATKILTQNYRNSQEITNLSNKLLKIKQLRFGSIDKESNYLIDSTSTSNGKIYFHKATQKNMQELNKDTHNSINFAIIVFNESSKQKIKKIFKTALIFTVREAKGLEYENIILVNFISDNAQTFSDISKNISILDLKEKLKYNRQKDKEDRELDAYKIYINSLYVAFTRAIKNLYIVEEKSHNLLEILEVFESEKENIKVKEATKEEWLEEAKKLEKVGKVEQVEEIRRNFEPKKNIFIKSKPIKVKLELEDYKKLVFEDNKATKSNKDKLFKLAKVENNLELIKKIGEKLNFKNAKIYLSNLGENSLKKAILNRDLSLLVNSIRSGANIDFVDKDTGFTLLMIASQLGYIEIARYLIKNGSDINLKGTNGATALILSSEYGHTEIVELLLCNNVNINVQAKNGASCLTLASGNKHIEIVKLLIKNGVNLNYQNQEGRTALVWTCENGYSDIAKLLIDYGADLDISNKHGETALVVALKNRHIKIAKYLIYNGANLDSSGINGATALKLASEIGNIEIVKLLIENGANLNLQNKFGVNALITSSQKGYTEIVKLLIESRANLNLLDKRGFSALYVSLELGHTEIAKILKENGAK